MDHARLPSLVRALERQGLGPAAITSALRRWKDGWDSNYDSGWREWSICCHTRGIDSTDPPRPAVTMVSWLASEGAKYSQYESFRSSFSRLGS